MATYMSSRLQARSDVALVDSFPQRFEYQLKPFHVAEKASQCRIQNGSLVVNLLDWYRNLNRDLYKRDYASGNG